MLRIYAAMAQNERECISGKVRAALAAAKARGKALGGDRGYRPKTGPNATAVAWARHEAAERAAHRLNPELERRRSAGVEGHAALARLMKDQRIPTPRGAYAWTHTTVARVMERAANASSATLQLNRIVQRLSDRHPNLEVQDTAPVAAAPHATTADDRLMVRAAGAVA